MTSGHGNFGICLDRSTTDGTGTAVLGIRAEFDNGEDDWFGFDSSGNRLGFATGVPQVQAPLFPLDSGFQWFNSGMVCSMSGSDICTTSAVLRQLSSSLKETSRTTLFQYQFGPKDPRPSEILWGASNDTGRGVFVTHVSLKSSQDSEWSIVGQRFDAAGTALGPAFTVDADPGPLAQSGPLPRPANLLSGVSRNGPVLVLWADGNAPQAFLRGRWLDSNGKAMGPRFVAANVPTGAKLSLSRLLDGSLALQQDGAWTLQFQPGASGAAAPDWLATRPNTRLSIIRGGTAYLLTFPSSNCEPVHAALFTASGTRCGAMDFSTDSCAHTAESGFDGTVIVSGFDEKADKCTGTFWPQLLR